MAEKNIMKKHGKNTHSPTFSTSYNKSTKKTKKSKKLTIPSEEHALRRQNFYLTASNPELSSNLHDLKTSQQIREEEMEHMWKQNMMITRPFNQDKSIVKTLPLDKKQEEQLRGSIKQQRKLSSPEAYHSVLSYNRGNFLQRSIRRLRGPHTENIPEPETQASLKDMLSPSNAELWRRPLNMKEIKVGSSILGISLTKENCLVTSSVDNYVRVFDTETGNMLETLSIKSQNKKLQVFQAAKSHDSRHFIIASGEAVTVWSNKGKMDKEYADNFCQFCKHLYLDENGSIFATDSDKHCIIIISNNGNSFKSFGTKGDNGGELFCPTGIVSLSTGDVVVADWKSRIQVFDKDGDFKYSFGRKGPKDGELELPYGLAKDTKDNIVVADWWNNRVSAFSYDGTFIRHLLTQEDGIVMPAYVCVGPDQKLYVSEFGSKFVKLFQF